MKPFVTLPLLVLLAACAGPAQEAPPERASFTTVTAQSIASGSEALAAFAPVRDAVLEGGECRRSPLPQEGAERLMATFPSRAEPETQITLVLGANGEVLRYTEMRGVPRPQPGTTAEEIRARLAGMVRTFFQMDHTTGEAMAFNNIPGQPSQGVRGSVSEFENTPALGDFAAGAARVQEVCQGEGGR